MRKNRLAISVVLYLALCVSCPHIIYAADMAGVQILETSSDGMVIRYQAPELEVSTKTVEGRIFQVLSFENCGFTNEVGKAQVPIKVLCLGIPDGASPSVSILNARSIIQTGHTLYPVENQLIRQETGVSMSGDEASGEPFSDIRYIVETEFAMDREFYRTHKFYPADLAKIEPVGYIRQQRVARLELHPVQYDPAIDQLKIYKTLEVKITFHNATGAAPSRVSGIQNPKASDHDVYEDLYQDTMLNYEQAKSWRKPRQRDLTSFAMAPSRNTAASLDPGQGTWYKISIEKNGIYKLDHRYLKNAGADPTEIDPRKIELVSGGEQVPIYVEGYDDGRFDPDDYIEFYGMKVDSLYTDTNIYWLSLGGLGSSGTQSWIMPVKDGSPEAPDIVPPIAFWASEHWEKDVLHDPLKNVESETADHFFWTQMRGDDPIGSVKDNFVLGLPYRASNRKNPFILRVCFQGITSARGASDHKIEISLNDIPVGIAEWEGQTEHIIEIPIPQTSLRRNNYFKLRCLDDNDTYNRALNDPRYVGPEWDVYLNWIEVDYWRDFRSQDNRLEFSTNTLPAVTKTVQFSVTDFFGTNIEIFQLDRTGAVAKIINPRVEETVDRSYTVTFQDKVLQPTGYIVLSASSALRPASIVKDTPSTLHDPANKANYIMITHKNFRESTERLADFRRDQGLDVIVIDVDDIYDEFSYGVFDPKAIKRFLRYAYFNWDNIPVYVLLMGDAHWDYMYVKHQYYVKYEVYPRIYVPTYHAPSMPYGESALDHRFVTISGDDVLPDMFIGRIPAESVEEADNVVDKIIRYESDLRRGPWQSRILMVADDDKSKSGDEVFENSRVELVDYVIPVGYEAIEAYLRKVREPYLVEQMIIEAFNKGVVIAEYAGHGGIHHWAHEGVFSLNALDKLQNYNKYPFVITTTCDNGYFDNPMSKSIMEVFLEQRRRGAIACLSATRLTYGQGNAAFDKILYPKMFGERPPILGKIIAEAKIDFINLGLTSWIGPAEQYTLFGDPATRLALPELEIEPKLVNTVVDSANHLHLQPGTVKRWRQNPITGKEERIVDTGFNADMRISVVYPNNRDENQFNDIAPQTDMVNIWEGEFDQKSITIPGKVVSGEGRLRCYANTEHVSAIGGILFSVSEPLVEHHTTEIINEEFLQVYAAIADNQGGAGIKSVTCRWHNSVTWKWQINDMKPGGAPPNAPETEGLWYKLEESIPLSTPGTYIDYEIHVLDTEGSDEVITPLERIRVPIGVNLAISRTGFSLLPIISYSYSQTENAWTLSATVENNGGKLIKQPVALYFFEGNPDRNRDYVVDATSELLGSTVIEYVEGAVEGEPVPGQWRPGENVLQIADVPARLAEPLYSGSHHIFVWINPRTTTAHRLPGIKKVEDADRVDDKADKLFQINEFAVGTSAEPIQVQSLDGTLGMLIPPHAVDQTVMSIAKLNPPESEWKQPDITLAPMPDQGLDGGAFKIELASGVTSFKEETQISIRFDATSMRNMARKLKGLDDKPDAELSPTEKEWIELACQEEAGKLGIFAWKEDIGVWKYVPSELVTQRQSLVENDQTAPFLEEPYVTFPRTQNRSDIDLTPTNIIVDGLVTPLGHWAVFFLNSDTYRVYLRREGMTVYEKLKYGEVGTAYYDDRVGLTISILDGKRDFNYGDAFTFNTYQDVDGLIKLSDLKSNNTGDGPARITVMTPEESRSDSYVIGEWSVFFVSPESFEIFSADGSPIKDAFGQPITGQVGKELSVYNVGVKIEVHAGKWPFQFGDRVIFRTLSTGIVRTNISLLEVITLMHSNDHAPPDIQIWINKQVPQDGAVVAPRSDISLLMSDANGIDVGSLSFLVSMNDRDFHPIPSEDYTFSERIRSSSFVTNVPIFYSPTLNIGKYKYRVDVMDFNGNRVKTDKGEYLEFMFLVEEKPDINPPIIDVTTGEGLPLADRHVFDTSHLEFFVDISDDHALDPATVSFSLGHADEPLEPLEEDEYTLTISDDFESAQIIYTRHLMNGEYAMQVAAIDTSLNAAYLSPPEAAPLRFRVDETVEIGRVLNMPNPFQDNTVFCYSLTQPADRIIIKIYTIRGRLVRTLEEDSPGWLYNEVFWDGRDKDGDDLASGVYLFKFTLIDADRKLEQIGKLAIVR